MKQGKELIAQRLKNLQTPAGLTTTGSNSSTNNSPCTDKAKQVPVGRELEQAINSLFTLLEDAYPLKFKRAFPTHEDQIRAKRVWKSALKEFNPRRIWMAGKKALDSSKFFPDLSDIRELCKLRYDELGLREPLQAYYEACHAPKQTRDYCWSHLAVYLAAKETGWLTLQSQEQRIAFPIFERNYEIICNRVLDGEDLEATVYKGLEDSRTKELSRQAEEIADQAQRQLMTKQGIDPDCGKAALEKLRKTLKT